MPHSEETERAVLACVLLKPPLAPQLFDLLGKEMFYLERHQEIYDAFRRLHTAGFEIDLRTMQADLEAAGKFEAVGGFAYLAGLDMDLPDISRFEAYCSIVRERWGRRAVIIQFGELSAKALSSEEDLWDSISSAQEALLSVSRDSAHGVQYLELTEALLDVDVFTERPGGMLGLPTGFVDLDDVTLGLQRGQLWILAGRPSMGKTSLAVQIAAHQARSGYRVGFCSLEDRRDRITIKLLSQVVGIPHQRLALGRTTKRERQPILDAMQELSKCRLYIDDAGGQTVEQIAAGARQLAVKKGLDILYIDYLHLINSRKRSESRNLEVGKMVMALKALAKGLDIPIVLLSQLSRALEKRPDKRPMLSDLRDSGEIEQHADGVMFVYRGEWYDREDPGLAGLAEVIVAKNKGGETGAVGLAFQGECTKFYNLDRDHADPPEQPGFWNN